MGVMPNSTGAQMTKHTPGPWLVDRWPTKHHGCYGWSIRPVRQDIGAITGHQICCQYEAPHAVNFNLPADGSTDEANLRLIAAAPELLEYAKAEQTLADFTCPHDVTNARRMCESCGIQWGSMVRWVEKLRAAAIAKAEGK